MQGNPKIIATLNALLADELAARDQYLTHARTLERRGYARIAARMAHEVDDESAHASALIKRILFLEGTPTIAPSAVNIGQTVPDMLKNDLAVELRVRDNLADAIALCEAEHDAGTRDVLMVLLNETERDHIDWLEQQLEQITTLGLPLYLSQQLTV